MCDITNDRANVQTHTRDNERRQNYNKQQDNKWKIWNRFKLTLIKKKEKKVTEESFVKSLKQISREN